MSVDDMLVSHNRNQPGTYQPVQEDVDLPMTAEKRQSIHKAPRHMDIPGDTIIATFGFVGFIFEFLKIRIRIQIATIPDVYSRA